MDTSVFNDHRIIDSNFIYSKEDEQIRIDNSVMEGIIEWILSKLKVIERDIDGLTISHTIICNDRYEIYSLEVGALTQTRI